MLATQERCVTGYTPFRNSSDSTKCYAFFLVFWLKAEAAADLAAGEAALLFRILPADEATLALVWLVWTRGAKDERQQNPGSIGNSENLR